MKEKLRFKNKQNEKVIEKIRRKYENNILTYETIAECKKQYFNKIHRITHFYNHVYVVLNTSEKIYLFSYKSTSKNLLYLCIGGPKDKTMQCKGEIDYLFFNNSDSNIKVSGVLIYKCLIFPE